MTPVVVYDTSIRHARREQRAHSFRYRHPMWLVDLDEMPRLPRALRPFLARFEAGDHLGDPDRTIRANLDAYLAQHGLAECGAAAGGRIEMLANPRSLGHAFNPLTVFWCRDRDGALRAIVAEVHNTFGGRHCYLLRPDERGRARARKELYVSPFFAVDGTYDMSFTEPGEGLHIAITLRRGEDASPAFSATLHGRRRRHRSMVRAALRHPWSSWRVSALIRFEGLRLWFAGLPVVPRPTATDRTVDVPEVDVRDIDVLAGAEGAR